MSGWYYKSAQYIQNTKIHCAFVSTNSITQGEQVSSIWEPLYELFSIQINFAWKSFKWKSEASEQAAVHVVIIGFSRDNNIQYKKIYDVNNRIVNAHNISPYLLDAPTVFVYSAKKPFGNRVELIYGSMPIDDGYLILDDDDVKNILTSNPECCEAIRKYIGGYELINNKVRYCLWLDGVKPSIYNKCKFIMDRIEMNRLFRLSSKRSATKKLAEYPQLFGEIRQPDTEMLVIPKVSSEKRRYLPVAMIKPDIIVNGSALIMPNANHYLFGILNSNIHNEWMRTVAGRMKSDYQYSASIVYNNFPFPKITEHHRKSIEQTAQNILEARKQYKGWSLAELYNELTMPPELRKAHQANDKAVMEAYGFIKKVDSKATWYSPSECVSALMKMYQELTSKK